MAEDPGGGPHPARGRDRHGLEETGLGENRSPKARTKTMNDVRRRTVLAAAGGTAVAGKAAASTVR
ncbi:hypothetical protein, partial [Streptomyces rhizosphaericus]|uniref:hypothetical protein n=1 Tax=Streptomyces rhizosphaericus TaxID=114699 RepID=UPI001ABFB0D3